MSNQGKSEESKARRARVRQTIAQQQAEFLAQRLAQDKIDEKENEQFLQEEEAAEDRVVTGYEEEDEVYQKASVLPWRPQQAEYKGLTPGYTFQYSEAITVCGQAVKATLLPFKKRLAEYAREDCKTLRILSSHVIYDQEKVTSADIKAEDEYKPFNQELHKLNAERFNTVFDYHKDHPGHAIPIATEHPYHYSSKLLVDFVRELYVLSESDPNDKSLGPSQSAVQGWVEETIQAYREWQQLLETLTLHLIGLSYGKQFLNHLYAEIEFIRPLLSSLRPYNDAQITQWLPPLPAGRTFLVEPLFPYLAFNSDEKDKEIFFNFCPCTPAGYHLHLTSEYKPSDVTEEEFKPFLMAAKLLYFCKHDFMTELFFHFTMIKHQARRWRTREKAEDTPEKAQAIRQQCFDWLLTNKYGTVELYIPDGVAEEVAQHRAQADTVEEGITKYSLQRDTRLEHATRMDDDDVYYVLSYLNHDEIAHLKMNGKPLPLAYWSKLISKIRDTGPTGLYKDSEIFLIEAAKKRSENRVKGFEFTEEEEEMVDEEEEAGVAIIDDLEIGHNDTLNERKAKAAAYVTSFLERFLHYRQQGLLVPDAQEEVKQLTNLGETIMGETVDRYDQLIASLMFLRRPNSDGVPQLLYKPYQEFVKAKQYLKLGGDILDPSDTHRSRYYSALLKDYLQQVRSAAIGKDVPVFVPKSAISKPKVEDASMDLLDAEDEEELKQPSAPSSSSAGARPVRLYDVRCFNPMPYNLSGVVTFENIPFVEEDVHAFVRLTRQEDRDKNRVFRHINLLLDHFVHKVTRYFDTSDPSAQDDEEDDVATRKARSTKKNKDAEDLARLRTNIRPTVMVLIEQTSNTTERPMEPVPESKLRTKGIATYTALMKHYGWEDTAPPITVSLGAFNTGVEFKLSERMSLSAWPSTGDNAILRCPLNTYAYRVARMLEPCDYFPPDLLEMGNRNESSVQPNPRAFYDGEHKDHMGGFIMSANIYMMKFLIADDSKRQQEYDHALEPYDVLKYMFEDLLARDFQGKRNTTQLVQRAPTPFVYDANFVRLKDASKTENILTSPVIVQRCPACSRLLWYYSQLRKICFNENVKDAREKRQVLFCGGDICLLLGAIDSALSTLFDLAEEEPYTFDADILPDDVLRCYPQNPWRVQYRDSTNMSRWDVVRRKQYNELYKTPEIKKGSDKHINTTALQRASEDCSFLTTKLVARLGTFVVTFMELAAAIGQYKKKDTATAEAFKQHALDVIADLREYVDTYTFADGATKVDDPATQVYIDTWNRVLKSYKTFHAFVQMSANFKKLLTVEVITDEEVKRFFEDAQKVKLEHILPSMQQFTDDLSKADIVEYQAFSSFAEMMDRGMKFMAAQMQRMWKDSRMTRVWVVLEKVGKTLNDLEQFIKVPDMATEEEDLREELQRRGEMADVLLQPLLEESSSSFIGVGAVAPENQPEEFSLKMECMAKISMASLIDLAILSEELGRVNKKERTQEEEAALREAAVLLGSAFDQQNPNFLTVTIGMVSEWRAARIAMITASDPEAKELSVNQLTAVLSKAAKPEECKEMSSAAPVLTKPNTSVQRLAWLPEPKLAIEASKPQSIVIDMDEEEPQRDVVVIEDASDDERMVTDGKFGGQANEKPALYNEALIEVKGQNFGVAVTSLIANFHHYQNQIPNSLIVSDKVNPLAVIALDLKHGELMTKETLRLMNHVDTITSMVQDDELLLLGHRLPSSMTEEQKQEKLIPVAARLAKRLALERLIKQLKNAWTDIPEAKRKSLQFRFRQYDKAVSVGEKNAAAQLYMQEMSSIALEAMGRGAKLPRAHESERRFFNAHSDFLDESDEGVFLDRDDEQRQLKSKETTDFQQEEDNDEAAEVAEDEAKEKEELLRQQEEEKLHLVDKVLRQAKERLADAMTGRKADKLTISSFVPLSHEANDNDLSKAVERATTAASQPRPLDAYADVCLRVPHLRHDGVPVHPRHLSFSNRLYYQRYLNGPTTSALMSCNPFAKAVKTRPFFSKPTTVIGFNDRFRPYAKHPEVRNTVLTPQDHKEIKTHQRSQVKTSLSNEDHLFILRQAKRRYRKMRAFFNLHDDEGEVYDNKSDAFDELEKQSRTNHEEAVIHLRSLEDEQVEEEKKKADTGRNAAQMHNTYEVDTYRVATAMEYGLRCISNFKRTTMSGKASKSLNHLHYEDKRQIDDMTRVRCDMLQYLFFEYTQNHAPKDVRMDLFQNDTQSGALSSAQHMRDEQLAALEDMLADFFAGVWLGMVAEALAKDYTDLKPIHFRRLNPKKKHDAVKDQKEKQAKYDKHAGLYDYIFGMIANNNATNYKRYIRNELLATNSKVDLTQVDNYAMPFKSSVTKYVKERFSNTSNKADAVITKIIDKDLAKYDLYQPRYLKTTEARNTTSITHPSVDTFRDVANKYVQVAKEADLLEEYYAKQAKQQTGHLYRMNPHEFSTGPKHGRSGEEEEEEEEEVKEVEMEMDPVEEPEPMATIDVSLDDDEEDENQHEMELDVQDVQMDADMFKKINDALDSMMKDNDDAIRASGKRERRWMSSAQAVLKDIWMRRISLIQFRKKSAIDRMFCVHRLIEIVEGFDPRKHMTEKEQKTPGAVAHAQYDISVLKRNDDFLLPHVQLVRPVGHVRQPPTYTQLESILLNVHFGKGVHSALKKSLNKFRNRVLEMDWFSCRTPTEFFRCFKNEHELLYLQSTQVQMDPKLLVEMNTVFAKRMDVIRKRMEEEKAAQENKNRMSLEEQHEKELKKEVLELKRTLMAQEARRIRDAKKKEDKEAKQKKDAEEKKEKEEKKQERTKIPKKKVKLNESKPNKEKHKDGKSDEKQGNEKKPKFKAYYRRFGEHPRRRVIHVAFHFMPRA